MHGIRKGKEGTNIKGRQETTHFECSKSKIKSKKKLPGAFFAELLGFYEEWRAPSWSLNQGKHSSGFETQKPIFIVHEYAGTEPETEWVNQSRMIIIFIIYSQKNYCTAQFKVRLSSGQKRAHG